MPIPRLLSRLLVACLPLLGAACGGDPPPDLLLVSLDTLRADHLSCYGHERRTSPFLDGLAAEGVRFARAWAPASNTAPSHMSLMTGLDPLAHGVRPVDVSAGQSVPGLASSSVTLAEALQRAGYRTVGLADDGYLIDDMGFGRGFETFRNKRTSLPQKITQLAAELRATPKERPLFLFLHTYETHSPYVPPRRYHGRFTDPEYDGEFRRRYAALVDQPLARAWEARGDFLDPFEGMDEADVEFLRGLYDEGIAYADDMMARVWKLWSRWRDEERTVFVVLSDHGEGFLEHGRLGHRYGLHSELLHVPLIVRGPGLAPRVVEDDVSLTDLAPTLLELLDLPAGRGQGVSFLGALRDGDAWEGDAVSQLGSLNGRSEAVTRAPWKLYRRTPGGSEPKLLLYRHADDPFERRNVAEGNGEVLDELLDVLDARLAHGLEYAARHPVQSGGRLSEQQARDLDALGYAGDEDPPAE